MTQKYINCKGCKKRSIEPVNCHSICKEYLAFRAKKDEEIQKRSKEAQINQGFIEIRRNSYQRAHRGQRHQGHYNKIFNYY